MTRAPGDSTATHARSSPRRVTRRWRGLEKPQRQWWRAYLPAGAATAAAVLAVIIWTGPGVNTDSQLVQGGNGGALEDIDLLADGDAPDFVSESDDVEFYEWAAGEIGS